jgi:hypothetical protein
VALGQGKDVPNVLAGILSNIGEFNGIVQKMRDSDSDSLVERILQELNGSIVVSPSDVSLLIGTLRVSTDEEFVKDAQIRLGVIYNNNAASQAEIVKESSQTLKANVTNTLVSLRLLQTIRYLCQNTAIPLPPPEIDADNYVINDKTITSFIPLLPTIIELTQVESPLVAKVAVELLTLFSNKGGELLAKKYSIEKTTNEDALKFIGIKLAANRDRDVANAIVTFLSAFILKNSASTRLDNDRDMVTELVSTSTRYPGLTNRIQILLNSLGYAIDGTPLPGGAHRGGGDISAPEENVDMRGGAPDFTSLSSILTSPGQSKEKLMKFFKEIEVQYKTAMENVQNLENQIESLSDTSSEKDAKLAEKEVELIAVKRDKTYAENQIASLKGTVDTLNKSTKKATDAMGLLQQKYDTNVGHRDSENTEKQSSH